MPPAPITPGNVQENPHVASTDAAKLLTRVGMGMCQGRTCGDNAAQVLAAARGLTAADVGPFQAQAPVKPVLLGILARDRCSCSNEDSQHL